MGGKKRTKVVLLHVVLLACVLLLSGFYIFETNSIIKDRFAKGDIERKILELREEAKIFELELSELHSLNSLKELSSLLELEEIKNISYIQTKKSSPLVFNE